MVAITPLLAKPNALLHEPSPYLRKHAHNPVNWYPWRQEVLDRAIKENKPIFLSIGYSTCHWCHVMEDESFEDNAVAKVLNKHFISIKVDKEEFPNIDKKYQKLYRAIKSRRGGWPLSVFLTPKLEPYFITTYIPRNIGSSAKDIITLSTELGDLYQKKPKELQEVLKTFALAKKSISQIAKPSEKSLEIQALITNTIYSIEQQYDKVNGGFSSHPKFPEASKIELLINIYKITGNQQALTMAKHTLKNMAKRGIYDQLEGGFFRYSNVEAWTIPHFQKMLYVNAQMIPQYLNMYQLTKESFFLNVAKNTIAEMERHFMQNNHYFSASDADDKHGQEGGYYMYTYESVGEGLKKEGLSDSEIEKALSYFGIEEDGNFDSEFAHLQQVGTPPKQEARVRAYLLKIRSKRDFPFVDKKIITSWNAMMVKALFVMAKHDPSTLKKAHTRLEALLSLMLDNNRLYHQTLIGKKPTQPAQLEDYAYLIDTLLTAHQVSLKKSYLSLASRLAYQAKEQFKLEEQWYLTTKSPKVEADFDDKYYSSALGVLLNGFLTLANINDDLKLGDETQKVLKNYGHLLTQPQERSSFVTLALRSKAGVITIKSSKENLRQHKEAIMGINYPFLLQKIHPYSEYLACRLGLCFATSKIFKGIKLEIEEAKKEIIEQPKKILWGAKKSE